MNKGSTSNALDKIKWLVAILVFTAAVVGNSYFVEVAFLYRVLGVVALFIIGLGVISITNFGSNSIKLMKESRTEIRKVCLLYTSPSPRDGLLSRMPSSA